MRVTINLVLAALALVNGVTTEPTIILYGDQPFQFNSKDICQVHVCFDGIYAPTSPDKIPELHSRPPRKQN